MTSHVAASTTYFVHRKTRLAQEVFRYHGVLVAARFEARRRERGEMLGGGQETGKVRFVRKDLCLHDQKPFDRERQGVVVVWKRWWYDFAERRAVRTWNGCVAWSSACKPYAQPMYYSASANFPRAKTLHTIFVLWPAILGRFCPYRLSCAVESPLYSGLFLAYVDERITGVILQKKTPPTKEDW